jgi:putative transposase
VATLLTEAEERVQRQLGVRQKGPGVAAIIERACQQAGVSAQELRGGSRRGQLSQIRATLAHQLVEDFGLPLAEVARQLGVTSSAIYKALQKWDSEKFH